MLVVGILVAVVSHDGAVNHIVEGLVVGVGLTIELLVEDLF